MSVPFTTDPTADDFDMHNIAVADEIYEAIYERSEAHGIGAVLRPSPPSEDDVFTSGFLAACQSWILTVGHFGLFLDHTQAVAGNFTGESAYKFPRFTIATLLAAAGLPGASFRRVEEWDGVSPPSFSSGPLQEGDIIGYWIFEDIINCLSVMKWTVMGYTDDPAFENFSYGSQELLPVGATQRTAYGFGRTFAEAVSANAAAWSGAAWGPQPFFPEAGIYLAAVASLTGVDEIGPYYSVGSARDGFDSTSAVNVPIVNPCVISFYVRLYPSVTLGATFEDIDSFTSVNTWYKYDGIPEAQTSTRVGAGIGIIATNPAALVAIAAGSGTVAAAGAGLAAVMEWNFSHCNP